MFSYEVIFYQKFIVSVTELILTPIKFIKMNVNRSEFSASLVIIRNIAKTKSDMMHTVKAKSWD